MPVPSAVENPEFRGILPCLQHEMDALTQFGLNTAKLQPDHLRPGNSSLASSLSTHRPNQGSRSRVLVVSSLNSYGGARYDAHAPSSELMRGRRHARRNTVEVARTADEVYFH